MRYKFSPSLMCMDLLKIREQIQVLNKYADYLHVDIMDGHYVKNFALSPMFIEQIRPITDVAIDAHMIMDNPEEFIEMTADAGADFITPYAETINRNAFRIIEQVQKLDCKVGVALNPATPLDYIGHYLHLIDKLTLMTVDPGYAGQQFIEEMLKKISYAKKLKEQNGFHYEIEIDGAGRKNTFARLAQAGAEVFIVGTSGLFSLDEDMDAAWKLMTDGFNEEVGKEKAANAK